MPVQAESLSKQVVLAVEKGNQTARHARSYQSPVDVGPERIAEQRGGPARQLRGLNCRSLGQQVKWGAGLIAEFLMQ